MNHAIGVVLVLAALFSASISRAELPGEPHLERMKTELKLSDQQAREVRKIFDEVRPQWEALRQQRRELQEKTRERLKSVLTPEQMQQFDKIHEEHKAHRKLGRHGRS